MENNNNTKRTENDQKILNKLNDLEQKVLHFLNIKLNVNLTGNEKKIDLNNKNIDDSLLILLCSIDFPNLEEINLRENNISNFEPLKDIKNLKNIDLSFNKIEDITPLKKISESNKEIEKLNLNNNSIYNIDLLKENIFPKIREINIDNNLLFYKDIEEIKSVIKSNNKNISIIKNQNSISNIFEELKPNSLLSIYMDKSEILKDEENQKTIAEENNINNGFKLFKRSNKKHNLRYYECEKNNEDKESKNKQLEEMNPLLKPINGFNSITFIDLNEFEIN